MAARRRPSPEAHALGTRLPVWPAASREQRPSRRQALQSWALPACLAWSCAVPRAAVPLRLDARLAPADARVFIDERYIGPLHWVAAHGVRLPEGAHRISVERKGYFPWDRLVEADRAPIRLHVKLEPVPDGSP